MVQEKKLLSSICDISFTFVFFIYNHLQNAINTEFLVYLAFNSNAFNDFFRRHNHFSLDFTTLYKIFLATFRKLVTLTFSSGYLSTIYSVDGYIYNWFHGTNIVPWKCKSLRYQFKLTK